MLVFFGVENSIFRKILLIENELYEWEIETASFCNTFWNCNRFVFGAPCRIDHTHILCGAAGPNWAGLGFWISLNFPECVLQTPGTNTIKIPLLQSWIADYRAPKLILIRLFDTFRFVASISSSHSFRVSSSFSHSFSQ